jgi:hypothetical protein
MVLRVWTSSGAKYAYIFHLDLFGAVTKQLAGRVG